MTPEEFNAISVEVATMFPSLEKWFLALNEAQRAAMKRRNRANLIECDPGDVRTVLADFLRSPIDPWPYDSDKERASAIIAKAANEIRAERKNSQRVRHDIESVGAKYKRPAGVKSIWDASEELVALKKSEGWTDEKTAEWLAAKFPEEPHDKRGWVQCTACGDTGLILCLSSIQRINGRIVHTTGVAACGCQVGQVFSNRKDERTRLRNYNNLEHVRIPAGCSGEKAAALLDMARARHEASRREGSFDNFNQRVGGFN